MDVSNKQWMIIGVSIVLFLVIFAVYSDMREEGTVRRQRQLYQENITVGDVVVDKITLNPQFSAVKRPVLDFYKAQLNRTDAYYRATEVLEEMSDNIATLNVHTFRPINLEHKKSDCMRAPIRLMDRFNISVLALQEVPAWEPDLSQFQDIVEDAGLYHTINDFDAGFAKSKEPITNVVISQYPIVIVKKHLLPSEPIYRFRHRHAIYFQVPQHPILGGKTNRLLCATHLEIGSVEQTSADSVRARKTQLREIMAHKPAPDIILGDLNLLPESAEYKKLETKYVTDVADYTIPTYDLAMEHPTVDYIWTRENTPGIKTYAVNYLWSDHRPVIGYLIRD